MGLKNHISLSHCNILRRAHQWPLSYKEALRCHTSRDFVSHMQEWSILLQFDVGVDVEVCKDGCEVCDFHMEN